MHRSKNSNKMVEGVGHLCVVTICGLLAATGHLVVGIILFIGWVVYCDKGAK